MNSFDPVSCLSQGLAPSNCAFQATGASDPPWSASTSRSEARADTISLNLDRLVCPRLPVCDAVIGNITSDATHPT